jgi:Sec-independent protein translocase protein TatA
VLIVLLIAGPKRITRLFRSAGSGVRRIRRRATGEESAPGLPAPGARDVDAPDGGR